MNKVTEMWKSFKKDKTAKKESNKDYSTKCLIDSNINFESKNSGYHLIIKENKHIIDFYPSTGKWKYRNSTKGGRGIETLLYILNEQKGGWVKTIRFYLYYSFYYID